MADEGKGVPPKTVNPIKQLFGDSGWDAQHIRAEVANGLMTPEEAGMVPKKVESQAEYVDKRTGVNFQSHGGAQKGYTKDPKLAKLLAEEFARTGDKHLISGGDDHHGKPQAGHHIPSGASAPQKSGRDGH